MWIYAVFSRKKNVGFGFMRDFELYILHNSAALWIIIVRLTRSESSCVVVCCYITSKEIIVLITQLHNIIIGIRSYAKCNYNQT